MARVLARFISAYWVGMRLDVRYGSGVLTTPGGHEVLGTVISGYEGYGEHAGQRFKQATAHYPHSTFREDFYSALPVVNIGAEKTFETIDLQDGDWNSKLGRFKSYGPFYKDAASAISDLMKFHKLVTFGHEWEYENFYLVQGVEWDKETDDGFNMTPEQEEYLSYPLIVGADDPDEIPDALSDFSAWLVAGYDEPIVL